MRFEDLLTVARPNGVFRTGEILAGQTSPAHVRRQLGRWVKSKRIIRLRRGVYLMSDLYSKASAHPFAVANALKKASYVSLQSALAHHGMIPEYVPVTTSVTTGRPEELTTPMGRFQFRHVAIPLLFGFGETEVARDQMALLAGPEKALVDLLYLTPHSDRVEYLRELRLERTRGLDLEGLHAVVERCRSAKIERAVKRLLELWENRGPG